MRLCFHARFSNALNCLCTRKVPARTVSLEQCKSCPRFVGVEQHAMDARGFM